MSKINCKECRNFSARKGCKFSFRWAAGAAGQAVNDESNVYFCQDYDECDDDNEYDNE